ncbi:MAG: hypothetical protein WBA77_00595 [Microcoleaceae cyanobacterium]
MHSLKVQQNNSCRVAISFGWTVPQLFAGKSVTRRRWKDSYGQQFIKRWRRGITTYIALDKNWRQGGKQIGWITLTSCPYKERLCEMRYEDVAAEGFPELTRDEFIERFFNGDDQQEVWVVRFRFTPLFEENCSAGIVPNLNLALDTEDVNSSPGGKSCSTGIGANLDIALDTENVNSSPGGKSCSTGIARNLDIALDTENAFRLPVRKSCSTGISANLDDIKVSQTELKTGAIHSLQIGTRVCHKKSPGQVGTVIKAVVGSTRYFINWDAGSTSAVEGRNLSTILVVQGDCRKLLTTDPDYLLEDDGQLTIFSEDEPPYRDDFASEAAYLEARAKWELQYPKLAEAKKQSRSELQPIPVEQKVDIPVVQHSQVETVKAPKTRNTKPGRGNKPRQVKCNVTRNSSLGKSANTYWVYKFSFKVDGKYYNRSCSIPKEKVKRVIEMWESQQYSWIDIVEYIGKNPDKIVEKARGK